MIDKGKVTGLQMGILIYLLILGMDIMFVPMATGRDAERDLWISPIWGSIIGILTFWIAYQLNQSFPNETVFEYSERVVGKICGKAIGFIFLFHFFHETGILVREYSEFIIGNFLPSTPMAVVSGSFVLVCSFAVRGGVEVIGKMAQFLFPIYFLTILAILLLAAKEADTEFLFPIFENGLLPSVKGSISTLSWFSQIFVISMILPNLTVFKKALKWGMLSILTVVLTFILVNIMALLVLKNISWNTEYPFLVMIRYISYASFFEHIESIVMPVWITGMLIKVSLYYYALVLGTAKWLHLPNYRLLVFPFSWLLVLTSLWVAPSYLDLRVYFQSWTGYVTSVLTIIPLLLLTLAKVRKRSLI